jgi:hypothetical protein
MTYKYIDRNPRNQMKTKRKIFGMPLCTAKQA